MDPIEQIKQRIDLVELIREYIPLQLSGANMKARCPFHQEKSASFMVSMSKQIWHCFGCSEGGDLFTFLMKIEGIEFADALRLLAERAGVKLEKHAARDTSGKERLRTLIDHASQYFYQALLKSPQASFARDYLKQRHIDAALIDEFRIGYALADGDHLYQYLISKQFTPQEIIQAGLVIKREQGYGCFDRFRDRIMIPICSIHGEVIGFGGRILMAKDGVAKYMNSPQTPLYDKSSVLFGLDVARQAIRTQDLAIIVEGYMDFFALYRTGITHVVASSGTALTSQQIRLLKRFTSHLAFAFDTDSAGANATRRGIEMALTEGMDVRIVRMPRDEQGKPLYKDPDECVAADPNAWKQAVDQREPFLAFLMALSITPEARTDGFAKKQIVRTLLESVALLASRVEQDHWLAEIGRELSISPAILWDELRLLHKTAPTAHVAPNEQTIPSRPLSIDERLVALLAAHESIRSAIFGLVSDDAFTHSESRELYTALRTNQDHLTLTRASLLADKEYGSLTEDEVGVLAHTLAQRLVQQYRKAKIEKLRALMAEAENTHDQEAMKRYLTEFHCLQKGNMV